MIRRIPNAKYTIPDYGYFQDHPILGCEIVLIRVLPEILDPVGIEVPFVLQFSVGNHSRFVLNQTKETLLGQNRKRLRDQNMNYND